MRTILYISRVEAAKTTITGQNLWLCQAGTILTYGKENWIVMKKNTHQVIAGAILCALIFLTGFNTYAQYPAASALLSNHIEHYSINSPDDYIRIEQKMNTIAAKLRDAHEQYPNLKYMPSFSNDLLTGFIITGVGDNAVANDLSVNLMLLAQLGDAVNKMDINFLPNIQNDKLSRVSKKKASR